MIDIFLIPAEIFFWIKAFFRNYLFDLGLKSSRPVGSLVIGVGSLTWSNPAQASLIQSLLHFFQQRGFRVAYVGGKRWIDQWRSTGSSGGGKGENEDIRFLQNILPDSRIFLGTDRFQASRQAMESGAEVIILDDGFRHRRIKRDLDILLIDTTGPRSALKMWPRGSLREPFSSLKRAGMVVLTTSFQTGWASSDAVLSQIRKRFPAKPVVTGLVEHKLLSLLEWPQFQSELIRLLRPTLLVASNGYGEDAIGLELLLRLRARFPTLKLLAFPLVGTGKIFQQNGFEIPCPPEMVPSEGIVKYHFSDLIKDFQSGLLKVLSSQFRVSRSLTGRMRGILCVGDPFLFAFTLLGTSLVPILLSTAKTEYLRGFNCLEKMIFRIKKGKIFCRDLTSADVLARSGIDAFYRGNPIMDIACRKPRQDIPSGGVLVLPGSREQAYQDFPLLVSTMEKIAAKGYRSFTLVPAPTIDLTRLFSALSRHGWKRVSNGADPAKDKWSGPRGLEVNVVCDEVGRVAPHCAVVLGLGGTSNQICAGLGLPVVSIKNKGKMVQKKLLGDGELLVEPRSEKLAQAVVSILANPTLKEYMSSQGKKRMGEPGCLDSVIDCVAHVFYLDSLLPVWERLATSAHDSQASKSN